MKRLCALCLLVTNMVLMGAYRVTPVVPSPESNTVVLSLVFPKAGENYSSRSIKAQMRLRGYPLSVVSSFERAKELRANKQGQTVHVFIDNRPYFTLDSSSLYNFDQSRQFYDNVLNFKIPFSLEPGEHLIRAVPTRSYGESIRDKEAFAMRLFYVDDPQRQRKLDFNPTGPLLTYNEPQGSFAVSDTQPVLLDFYLSNCTLSEVGYRIKLKIDGKQVAILTRWVPYYMSGFTRGQHDVTLELIDKRGKVVPGQFNKATRSIIIN